MDQRILKRRATNHDLKRACRRQTRHSACVINPIGRELVHEHCEGSKNDATNSSKTDEILRAFNTWAFKREQPSDQQLLQAVVARSVRRSEPVSFVAYWGKGQRDQFGGPDEQCLKYLRKMLARIEIVHAPGTEFHLIFTDSHARLNGHDASSTNKYFNSVETAACEHGFACWRLTVLTNAMRAALKPYAATPPQEQLLIQLRHSANKWYRGEKPIDVGAKEYFDLNIIEKRVIERVFPNSIFVTFNSSKLRPLFPERLPIFYMYSIKKGVAVKPWFQEASRKQECIDGDDILS
jgi:L-tyrosine isonitrile synthase